MSIWRSSDYLYLKWISDGWCVDTTVETLIIQEHKYPRTINAGIDKLQGLKTLVLIGLSLKIPTSIGNLHNLEELQISEQNIVTIPTEIGNLHSLKILKLECNNLTVIPASIGNLINLRSFDIYSNNIKTIPNEIGNLINLEELFISGAMDKIPTAIENLHNLKKLSIHGGIKTIPEEVFNLQNLEMLDLTRNKLTTVSTSIGNLHRLEKLSLTGNQLTTVPVEIWNLINLRTLSLSANNIITIPLDIVNLSNLRTLIISFNNITAIPAEIGNLINIRTLNLASNNITAIPAEIGNLINLQAFDISENPIDYIPPNVRRLLNRQTHAQGVYNDAQSVHNSTVQQSIKDSILRLISIKPTLESAKVIASILTDSNLTAFTKQSLVEYARNTDLIIEVNVSFLDVLTAVWNRIMTNDHSTEIKRVLNNEMEDAECKCFTGRMSRLVNCLSGFDSLVDVKIADNEQIGNVVAVIGDRLKDEGRYTVVLHKEIANGALKELGYSDDVIDAWINYIE